jgi:hypothetical protein
MRNLVFISHANPEENDFARWLGLQLTRAGYAIWSEVTKLIGGESFWEDIEEAIRNYTVKFLFVLSKTSNAKQGTLDELHLARTVAKNEKLTDFIIPLRVDDLSFSEINVAIHRLNVIDFTHGWAPGLAQVLDKLEKDKVPQDTSRFNPTAVSLWWKAHCDGDIHRSRRCRAESLGIVFLGQRQTNDQPLAVFQPDRRKDRAFGGGVDREFDVDGE